MDVTGAIAEISNAATAAATVGGAVLVALGVIMGFRVIRRAFS